jgi:hypothetical protein
MRGPKKKKREKICFVSWKLGCILVIFSLFIFLYTSKMISRT